MTPTKTDTPTSLPPNTLPPTEYANLGVTSGYTPVPPEDMRFLLLGLSGGGKSTLASNTPNTVVLDFEDGSREVVHSRAQRIWIKDYATYKQMIGLLVRDGLQKKPQWKRVVFDTGDKWLVMMDRQLARERSKSDRVYETMGDYGSHGAGWNALYKRMLFDLDQLYAAGYSWTITGHIAEKDITVGTGKSAETIPVQRPVLPRGIISQLEGESELTAFVEDRSGMRSPGNTKKTLPNKEVVVVPLPSQMVTEYVLRVEPDATRGEGKHRVDGLQGIVPLSSDHGWDDFVAHWQKAIDKIKQGKETSNA